MREAWGCLDQASVLMAYLVRKVNRQCLNSSARRERQRLAAEPLNFSGDATPAQAPIRQRGRSRASRRDASVPAVWSLKLRPLASQPGAQTRRYLGTTPGFRLNAQRASVEPHAASRFRSLLRSIPRLVAPRQDHANGRALTRFRREFEAGVQQLAEPLDD
jgi:hypothetical protein